MKTRVVACIVLLMSTGSALATETSLVCYCRWTYDNSDYDNTDSLLIDSDNGTVSWAFGTYPIWHSIHPEDDKTTLWFRDQEHGDGFLNRVTGHLDYYGSGGNTFYHGACKATKPVF